MECGKMSSKHRHEADKRVKNILTKCKKLGISGDQLAEALDIIFIPSESWKISFKVKIFIFVAILGVGTYFYYNIISYGRCWIDMPNFIVKATRPPEDCSMCYDIDKIPRLANLTPEEFEDHYAYSGIPIVVTDAATTWKALEVFDFWFFKDLYIQTDLGRAARDCQFFPYKTEFESLHEALEMDDARANLTKGTKPWYIGWSNCHDSVAKILRLYYEKPYFLPSSAENNVVDWIFMGGPGDGAQMHVDNVIHPSWQAQLKGRKRWYLSPPPECYYSCNSMEVVMYPGEIIVIDTNRWYHKTEILPGDISITIGAEYD